MILAFKFCIDNCTCGIATGSSLIVLVECFSGKIKHVGLNARVVDNSCTAKPVISKWALHES